MTGRTKAVQTSSNTPPPIPEGDIQFYDNYLPSVQAGEYIITVQTTLAPASGQTIPGYSASDLPAVQQQFSVTGPRFTIPPTDIHSLFPAPGSTGNFSNILPNIVFSKRLLPWERNLSGDPQQLSDPSIPWLALMVLTADQLRSTDSNKNVPSKAIAGKVSDFLPTKPDPSILTPILKDYDSDLEGNISCQTIQIDPATFQALVPSLSELTYLSHCRQKKDRWFSFVVANRFSPAPLEGSDPLNLIVHLVSLEGFQDYLNGASISQQYVQLFSLANWTFNSVPAPHENFANLMLGITAEQSRRKTPLLQLPTQLINDGSGEAAEAIMQLNKGYVPLLYRTRTADQTIAWYRGPLTPILPSPNSGLPSDVASTGVTDSSGLTIIDTSVDTSYGMFNLTYSGAWQLGRSLALADSRFTQQLLLFRKDHKDTALQAVHQKLLSAKVPGFAATTGTTAASNNQTTHLFLKNLQQGLIGHIGKALKTPKEATLSVPVPQKRKTIRAERQRQRSAYLTAAYKANADTVTVPVSILEWLAELYLLQHVPFQYLVSNIDMLPAESIRFFYVDLNWLNSLIDGALSIGLQSETDKALNQTIVQAFQTYLSETTGQVLIPQSGFLLRSAVVSGWPELNLRLPNAADQEISIVRQERLAPEVLIGLFNGVPSKVVLSQPHEQLTFGRENNNEIGLKQPLADNLGRPFTPAQTLSLTSFFRPGNLNVLNVNGSNGLISALTQKLTDLNENNPVAVGPAQFAVQMLRMPEQAEFVVSSSSLSL